MIEGMIAGLVQAADMCSMAANAERNNGRVQVADALEGMARSLRLRASEETTPADDGATTELTSLQTRWQRFWAWVKSL